jgi:YHS domain-containing protein
MQQINGGVKMAKQYTTDELIKAWIEGERGKFESDNNISPVELKDDGIFFAHGNHSRYFISRGDANVLWTKVQEPVDFMTAINSGKRIKAESYTYYYSTEEWLKELKLITFNIALKLINGKWLIEDGE